MTHNNGTSSSSGSASSTTKENKPSEERLVVAVRIRPQSEEEKNYARCVHAISSNTIALEESSTGSANLGDRSVAANISNSDRVRSARRYRYDYVFAEDATQEQVYNLTTKPLVQDVLSGFNGTVFAYGATGSGKTHSMTGPHSDDRSNNNIINASEEERGIMPRALNDVFKAVNESPNPKNYEVTMSYLEIYNENIRDLLAPNSGFLELREDGRGRNITVAGLSAVIASNTEEVMQLLQKGNKARTVEPTAANKTSSRSHALLSVTVKYTHSESSNPATNSGALSTGCRIRQGRLFLIDLAGSERALKTKNRGKRLQEGAHINRSLLALGNCINALSGGARYVNYRDSKLTRLLKEALSGNCRTVMVAHVSPSIRQRDETRNTLVYADRANRISTRVQSNEHEIPYQVSQYRGVISELREEIARLRHKMQGDRPRSGHIAAQSQAASPLPPATSTAHKEQVKQLREQIVGAFKEQMRLRRRLMEADSHLLGLGLDAERQHLVISHWETRDGKLYNRRTEEVPEDVENLDEEDEAGVKEDGRTSTASGQPQAARALRAAWAELASIERERERYAELRRATEVELEECRKRGAALEDELPARISCSEERELLGLMCRVHELEADKMALQSERLTRQHELRRRDLLLLRYDRQRQICDEIITRQRQLMEEGRLQLPPDLRELYGLYQQEIHAATFTADTPPSCFGDTPFYGPPMTAGSSTGSAGRGRGVERLPPITQSGWYSDNSGRSGSSSGSEFGGHHHRSPPIDIYHNKDPYRRQNRSSFIPPSTADRGLMGPVVLPPGALLNKPISPTPLLTAQTFSPQPDELPRPIFTGKRELLRSSSEESFSRLALT